MAHLPSFVSAGFGEYAKKELWYSQAIKIGNTIECSGQGTPYLFPSLLENITGSCL